MNVEKFNEMLSNPKSRLFIRVHYGIYVMHIERIKKDKLSNDFHKRMVDNINKTLEVKNVD